MMLSCICSMRSKYLVISNSNYREQTNDQLGCVVMPSISQLKRLKGGHGDMLSFKYHYYSILNGGRQNGLMVANRPTVSNERSRLIFLLHVPNSSNTLHNITVGYWPFNAHACGFWLLPIARQFYCDKCMGCLEISILIFRICCVQTILPRYFLISNAYTTTE
jgi:hypothetical protein